MAAVATVKQFVKPFYKGGFTRDGGVTLVAPGYLHPAFTTTRTGIATYRDMNGLTKLAPANMPRFDQGHLLIEESRTNLLTWSEDFTNAAWEKAGLTATGNLFTEDTSDSQRRCRQSVSVSAGVHTTTFHLKDNGRRYAAIYPQGAGSAYAIFDLQTGAVTATGGANYVSSSVALDADGYYRCSVSVEVAIAGTVIDHVYLTNSSVTPAPTYVGDGVSGVFVRYAQLEAGSFATSYIPTEASTVTRAADDIVCTDASKIGFSQSEGTFILEIDDDAMRTPTATMFILAFGDNGRFAYRLAAAAPGSIFSYDGTTITENTAATPARRFAVTWGGSTKASCINGEAPVETAYDGSWDGTGLKLGSLRFNGHISYLKYFNSRLPNAQLQSMTA